MKRIERLSFLVDLYEFKIIRDEYNTEYVVFQNSHLDCVEEVDDKTEFEALENHRHLLDKIRKNEFTRLFPIAESLGKSLLGCLKRDFANKHFVVFVSLRVGDSLIVRFHQKWAGEEPYYNPGDFSDSEEKVFMFEG